MQEHKWSWTRALLVLFMSGILSFLAGEIGIRLKDKIVSGTPFFANPTYSSVLRIRKYGIWVGRPHAHYRKWKLNAYGFRSEPISFHKKPGCTRVLIIGASEMFGLYESAGKDFAADLTRDLKPKGCFSVINAAMAGMGVMAAKVYWTHYLYKFKPDLVLVYPAPDINFMVYLHDPSGKPMPKNKAIARKPRWHFRSRLLDYLRSFIHMPASIANWRTRRAIKAKIAAHPKSWRLAHVPAAAMHRYRTSVEALVNAIRADGALPVLMTHALRITLQTYKSDESATLWVLSANPRATARAWIQNDTDSNLELKRIAAEYHLPVVHLSRKMSGCKACFFDGAHFTNLGAKRAALAASSVLIRVAAGLPQSHRMQLKAKD